MRGVFRPVTVTEVPIAILVEDLLEEPGYADSPFFLKKGSREFATASGVGNILRAASKPQRSLLGVYTLNDAENPVSTTAPVVYICKAKTEAAAEEVHRRIVRRLFGHAVES